MVIEKIPSGFFYESVFFNGISLLVYWVLTGRAYRYKKIK